MVPAVVPAAVPFVAPKGISMALDGLGNVLWLNLFLIDKYVRNSLEFYKDSIKNFDRKSPIIGFHGWKFFSFIP